MRIYRLMLLSVLSMTSTLAVAETMRMAVTTSFHNSGLSNSLLPAIERDIGLRVDLLVVGTGQAIRLGESGDVDALLVHSKDAEEAFVIGGYGSHRREIMYNDFVFVGPKEDPANLAAATSAQQALVSIVKAKAIFVSRGDESGTHKKELSLWHTADVDLSQQSAWYRSVGSGMGAALNTASGMNAYIITDRASWLNFRNKGDLALLYAGDSVLFNQYAYLPVSPERHSHVKDVEAQKLEDWLISKRAKELINGHQIAGEALFTFNAK